VFAGLLGWLLLSGHPDLRLGLVMLLVTPCTDWYLVFTGTARGNVALAASLLPPNLILQLVLLPLFVIALTGTAADIPLGDLTTSVAIVLGVPLLVAVVVRLVAARTGTHDRLEHALLRAQPVGLGLLAVAIVAIFATHARVVTDNPEAFLRLGVPLAAFFAATYLIATVTSSALRLRHPERATVTMATLARNSPSRSPSPPPPSPTDPSSPSLSSSGPSSSSPYSPSSPIGSWTGSGLRRLDQSRRVV
jgi:arsenite transporter